MTFSHRASDFLTFNSSLYHYLCNHYNMGNQNACSIFYFTFLLCLTLVTHLNVLDMAASGSKHTCINDLPACLLRRILAYATAADFVDEGVQFYHPRKRAECPVRLVCKSWVEAIDEDRCTFTALQQRCRVLGTVLLA